MHSLRSIPSVRAGLVLLFCGLCGTAAPAGDPPADAYTRLRLDLQGEAGWVDAVDVNQDGLKDLLVQRGRQISAFLNQKGAGFTLRAVRNATLPKDAFLFQVVAPGPGKPPRILFVTPEGVGALPADAGGDAPGSGAPPAPPVPQVLVTTPTIFRGQCTGVPARYAFSRDVNGDGRNDLLFPTADGYALYRQEESGGFARVQTFPFEPMVSNRAGGGTLQIRMRSQIVLPQLEIVDVNQDGRLDAAIFHGTDLESYPQAADGSFPARPAAVHAGILFGARDSGRRVRFLMRPLLSDLNGDGFPDLVGTDSGKGQTAVFLGNARGFPKDPNTLINVDGWIFSHWLADLRGKGKSDLIIARVEKLGVWGALKVLSTHALDVQILVYPCADNGTLPDEPAFEKTLSIPFLLAVTAESVNTQSLRWETPTLMSFDGDLNGDGVKDLLLKPRVDLLEAHFGDPKEVFHSSPDLRIPISDTSNYASTEPLLTDLNGDGKTDIVLHHRDFAHQKNVFDILLSR